MTPTPSRQLLDQQFDDGLDEFVAYRRSLGRSWESISRDIFMLTEQAVTANTLRRWFTSLEAAR